MFSRKTLIQCLIILSLLFLILIIFFLTFVTFLTVLSKRKKGDGTRIILKGINEIFLYKYLRVDSVMNTTTIGIARLPKGYEKDNKLVDNFNGVKTLITSDFGSKEYVCSGSCYCEKQSRRSSSIIQPLSKGLLFLVSAFSTTIAAIYAQDFFKKECEEGLENICEFGSIHSEVDECRLIGDIEKEEDEEYMSSTKTEKTSSPKTIEDSHDHEPTTTEFECIGYCSYINFSERKDHLSNDKDFWVDLLLEEGDYNDSIMYDIVVGLISLSMVGRQYCVKLELKSNVVVERIGSFDSQEELAMLKFTTVNLHKFCKSASLLSLSEISEMTYSHGGYEVEIEEFEKKVIGSYMETSGSGDKLSICRSIRNHGNILNTRCYRKLTDSEWEKGIPYENNNLRHWKKGYKLKPDRFTDGSGDGDLWQ